MFNAEPQHQNAWLGNFNALAVFLRTASFHHEIHFEAVGLALGNTRSNVMAANEDMVRMRNLGGLYSLPGRQAVWLAGSMAG